MKEVETMTNEQKAAFFYGSEFVDEERNDVFARAYDLINSIYKIGYADGAAERTGHWSRKTKVDAYDIAGVKTWGIKCQCDKCDFTTIVVEDFGYYKYCPNCGASMRGEEE